MRTDQPAGGRLRAFGEPIHPALVHYPIALLSLAPLAQAVGHFGDDPFWWAVGFWLLVGGLVTAAVSALTGLVDFTAIPREHPAHRTALYHLTANVVAVLFFLGSLVVQGGPDVEDGNLLALLLSLAGLLVLLVGGYLGGHLVFRHGLGLSEEAVPPPTKPRT